MIVSPCEWFALGQEMRPSPLAAENPSHQYRDRHEWCQAKALQRTETWPKGQLRLKAGFHSLVRMGPTETTRRVAGLRDSQWIIRGWHVAWWGPWVENYSSTSLGIVAVHGQREAAGIPPVG
jgi:hypothetical protein